MKFKKIFLSVLVFFLALGFFGCNTKTPEEEKQEFLEGILGGVVVDSSYKNLASDLILPDIAAGQYLITWTIADEYQEWAKIEDLEDGKQKIVITQEEGKANEFELVGKISEGSISATRTWKGYVKAGSIASVVTCKEAVATTVNEYIQVSGVVTYVYENTGFWVKDETGSIYVYVQGAFEPKVGDKVTVKGIKAIYYSLQQIKSPSIVINETGTIDLAAAATNATVEDMAQFAKDYASTESTKAEKDEIVATFGALYNLTGQILANTDSSISYKYILKDNITGEFVNLYDSPMNSATKTALEGLVGKYVTGTFMFWDIHSSGYGRFIPVATLTETTAPVATDAQKVSAAKKEIATLLSKDIITDIKLFTESALGATIAWTSSNESILTAAGKVGASENATEKVTLTAVITSGTETATVATEVTVKFPEPTTVKQVLDACDAGESIVRFKGKVIATDVDGYFYVADSTGVVYVRTAISTVDGLEVGNFVDIIGKTTVYKSSGKQYTRQITANSIKKITEEITVLAATNVTIADFAAITATEGVISDASINAYKADTKAYAIITFDAYVTIRGSYNNVYFATANDDTSAALYYYYKSADQEGVKALEGKLVTVTCVVYDIHGSDGWRLGSYLSIVEKTA